MKTRIRRDIKAQVGTGPMAETVEKVLAELILKASINKAKRLNGSIGQSETIYTKQLTLGKE